MGGNSSIASSSNNSHAESELQMRLRDRFQRTANSQSSATTAEDSNGIGREILLQAAWLEMH